MFKKNTPLKIVLIIFITEIVILIGLGIFFQKNIIDISNGINTGEITNLEQGNQILSELSSKVNITLIASSLVLVIITMGLSLYTSKMIVYPLNKYLKSKDEQKSNEEIELRKIILHTTEGIIAFNRDGSIALINPAAKRLLKISPEDNSFDDIFHKYNMDINMEKIIYLDNWTSTTERVNVGEYALNVLFSPYRDKQDIPARYDCIYS